jgi:MoxR-like ATPase
VAGGLPPGSELRVPLVLTHKLSHPIPRSVLREHPVLKDLSVLKFANATNFEVTPAQWQALNLLISETDQPVSTEPLGPSRIVKIAPGESAKYWQDCLEGDYICVGWDDVGDLRQYSSKAAFWERFGELYPYDGHIAQVHRKANELWTLTELRPGDVVVANRGTSEIVGIGTVTEQGYQWRPDRLEYRHTVGVAWDPALAGSIDPIPAWATVTVKPVPVDTYRDLLATLTQGEPPVFAPFDLATLRTEVASHGVLIGDDVLRSVLAALQSGKHLILTGPPGTAKTTLAEIVARCATAAGLAKGYVLTTATSDWTTYDTVGGLRPAVNNTLAFSPGQFLAAITAGKWLVVDELNRANFDRAFGQLFTVLSGQSVVLPYDDPETGYPIQLRVAGDAAPSPATTPIVIPTSWRIVATMNVFDKSLLFEMSFALMRRFAFIEVPAPDDGTYKELVEREADGDSDLAARLDLLLSPLLALRSIKELGPAIYIDMARFAAQMLRTDEDVSDRQLTFQLFYSYLLPQFEGISDDKARQLFSRLRPLVGTNLASRLRQTLEDVLGVQLPSAVAKNTGPGLLDQEQLEDEEDAGD